MTTLHHLSWLIWLAPALLTELWASDLSPAGLWKTVDDKTGEPKGMVRIYEHNGAFFGKIESSLKAADAKERCELCTDERKNKPIIGLVILRGLKKQGEEFSGGDILDPESGTVYRCKLRVLDQGKTLVVRGYVGVSVLGRSQTWLRVP
ncbi:MAG TPA: DUF2147 domain-containing protein [Bryobacteraceae bacterium]|nr:DUF2147 domain-containing protein [Bryobacteraceae bacterium]